MKTSMCFFLVFWMLLSSVTWAHGDGGHGKKINQSHDPQLLALINQAYLEKIKPIMEAKCFNCHSDQTKYPWYYQVPGVKQLIDHDIEEAREHMDMAYDFPFKSKEGDILEDLDEMAEVIEEGEMPPLLYKIMHWRSHLTKQDEKEILSWLRKSESLLKRAMTH